MGSDNQTKVGAVRNPKRIGKPRATKLIAAGITSLLTAGLSTAAHAQGVVVAGLKAHYTSSNGVVLDRLDPYINFDWGYGSPDPKLPIDNFACVWTGQVIIPKTGDYVFSTISDDGVRLYVDNRIVIDNYVDHGATQNDSLKMHMIAGTMHRIRMEYYEAGGGAVAKLLWNYTGAKTGTPIPWSYLVSTDYPNAPGGVAAAGGWGVVGKAAAATGKITLSWKPAVGALTYNVYRDGVPYKSSIVGTSFVDSGDLLAGEGHSYAVSSVNAAGCEGDLSSTVSAAPAYPTSNSALTPDFTPPSNLRIRGYWSPNEGAQTDILTWDPVPGAVQYTIYQYGTQIGITTLPFFFVPASLWHNGESYTVTATKACGCESLPSSMVTAQGSVSPGTGKYGAPITPSSVTATGEWNASAPRIYLTWRGSSSDDLYNIYRDGVLLARGIWGLNWYDNSVGPGESHVYAVSGTAGFGTQAMESAATAGVIGTAPLAAPKTSSAGIRITSVVANDDGATVNFTAVPGAVDYRVYDATKPTSVKYSGGGLAIEMNGLTPNTAINLVVEAVDKLGPYQQMDGEMGPGAMDMMGAPHINTNGQGDSSNIPNVLATSAPVSVTCKARTLTGAQAFFDNFRNDTPFVSIKPPADMVTVNGEEEVAAFQNNNWDIYNVRGDLINSRVFLMGNHFMETLYDGGGPFGPDPMHNNNASMVMKPHATADLSGGKVLHVTFEMDAHFGNRRWCEVWVADAKDTVLVPGKFAENNELPTTSGQIFRWQVEARQHYADLIQGYDSSGNLIRDLLFDNDKDPNGIPARTSWAGEALWNGTTHDIDKRHRFDLYISATRFQVYEENTLIKDAVFPNGAKLPFTNAQVYFIHQLYHSGLERCELTDYSPTELFWINHRSWADERHWDNMGQEVLSNFPGESSLVIKSDPIKIQPVTAPPVPSPTPVVSPTLPTRPKPVTPTPVTTPTPIIRPTPIIPTPPVVSPTPGRLTPVIGRMPVRSPGITPAFGVDEIIPTGVLGTQ